MSNTPRLRRAIVLQQPVLDGSVIAFTGVMQQEAVATIFGNREADRIALAIGRHVSALSRVAEITEISQLFLGGRPVLACGSA